MANERDERMQGGGYGGAQGRGGEGRDRSSDLGELQGGSYGRNTDRDLGTNRRNATDPADDRDRERFAQPPQEVDEDGRETSIEDEGRSPDWGEAEQTDLG